MTVKWIAKEVEGGGDGIAQVRSDYPDGIKLGDLDDGTPILLPDPGSMTAEEKKKYMSGDGLWSQCRNSSGGLFFPNPSGKLENWFELANSRSTTPPFNGVKKMQIMRVVFDLQTDEVFVEYKDVS